MKKVISINGKIFIPNHTERFIIFNNEGEIVYQTSNENEEVNYPNCFLYDKKLNKFCHASK